MSTSAFLLWENKRLRSEERVIQNGQNKPENNTVEERNEGRFTKRPPGAHPLFNPESGRQAALKRWEKQEARNREALIAFVSEELGEDVSYDQALAYTILYPQFRQALKGKAASAKLLLQLMNEIPDGADAKVLIDNRQVKLMNFRFTPPQAKAYIEDQRAQGNEDVASLVDSQMNWEMAEDEVIIIEVPLNDPN